MDMKKTLTITLLPLLMLSVRAQTHYRSVFGDTITTWTFVYQWDKSDFSSIASYYEHFASDTVIWDGTTYKYLRLGYSQETFYYDTALRTEVSFTPREFVLRESADHSRLYRRTSEEDEEILIMDLNWQVGDTVVLWDRWLGQSSDTTTIDSVYHVDGRKHLRTTHRLKFHPETMDTLLFIEGVGPTLGFEPFEASHVLVPLLCCYLRDLDDYQAIVEYERYFPGWQIWQQFGNTCFPPMEIGIADSDNPAPITIHPNPTHGIVHLELPDGGKTDVEVFDFCGLRVLATVLDGEKPKIDLSHLPRGVYFLNVNKLASSMIKLIKI